MNSKTGNTIIHFLLNSISFPVFFEVKSGENSCMHISDIFQKIDLKLFGMGSGQTRIACDRPRQFGIGQDRL